MTGLFLRHTLMRLSPGLGARAGWRRTPATHGKSRRGEPADQGDDRVTLDRVQITRLCTPRIAVIVSHGFTAGPTAGTAAGPTQDPVPVMGLTTFPNSIRLSPAAGVGSPALRVTLWIGKFVRTVAGRARIVVGKALKAPSMPVTLHRARAGRRNRRSASGRGCRGSAPGTRAYSFHGQRGAIEVIHLGCLVSDSGHHNLAGEVDGDNVRAAKYWQRLAKRFILDGALLDNRLGDDVFIVFAPALLLQIPDCLVALPQGNRRSASDR